MIPWVMQVTSWQSPFPISYAPAVVLYMIAHGLGWGLKGIWWGIFVINWTAAAISLWYTRRTLGMIARAGEKVSP